MPPDPSVESTETSTQADKRPRWGRMLAWLGLIALLLLLFTALRRTQLGPFRDERMWTLPELEALAGEGGEPALDAVLHGADTAVRHWPEVVLGEAEQAYVLQGQAVFATGPAGARVRMYGPDRLFLGVGEMTPEGRRVAPVRIMLDLSGSAA